MWSKNFSYTDGYDFSKKQSLDKFEIELGIQHHQELGLPWDESVPEELWQKNDVIATEGAFNARQILADVAGMTLNDTTNSLTTRIIFGKTNQNPRK